MSNDILGTAHSEETHQRLNQSRPKHALGMIRRAAGHFNDAVADGEREHGDC